MRVTAKIAPLIVAAVLLVLVPAPATAQPPSGYLHMYENDYYRGGTMGRDNYDGNFNNDRMCFNDITDKWYRDTDRDGCGNGDYWNVDDSISSVINRTRYWWKLYEHSGYRGFTICVPPYGYDNNIGNNSKYEDKISSVKRTSNTTTKPGGCDQVVG